MRTQRIVAGALIAGMALGGFAGIANTASAQSSGYHTRGTESSAITTVNLETKSAVFEHKQGKASFMYFAHLSQESRDNAILSSGLSADTVATGVVDEDGLALEQTPEQYKEWGENNVKAEKGVAEAEINAMLGSIADEDYDSAKDAYARAVEKLSDTVNGGPELIVYLVVNPEKFNTEGLTQVFEGEVAVPTKTEANPKNANRRSDNRPRPTVDARGDDNHRMSKVSGNLVESDAIIDNAAANGAH